MLSSNNILKPADGRPVTMPTQDMIIGLYYLTTDRQYGRPTARRGRVRSRSPGRGHHGVRPGELEHAGSDQGADPPTSRPPAGVDGPRARGSPSRRPDDAFLETTLGRALFNEALPTDYPFVNAQVDKKASVAIVNDLAERYPKVRSRSAGRAQGAGFHWATRSGVTVSISDVVTPPRKAEILAGYEAEAAKVEKLSTSVGLMTDRRASPGAHRDLDRRDRRGRQGDGGQLPEDQPDLHDGESGARGN
jgi:DNA-directed RNA polymerase subunit beta'